MGVEVADLKPTFKFDVPLCATRSQYVAWLEAEKLYPARFGFCTDCTPGYQAQMKAEGRCENPSVRFDEEGGVLLARHENAMGEGYVVL